LVAASNEEKMLEEQRLENAFNYLDADHSGFITIEEVKAFLDGTTETDEEIKKIFNEVD
jgi:Ca2+-binding EF-hand superfamily protein